MGKRWGRRLSSSTLIRCSETKGKRQMVGEPFLLPSTFYLLPSTFYLLPSTFHLVYLLSHLQRVVDERYLHILEEVRYAFGNDENVALRDRPRVASGDRVATLLVWCGCLSVHHLTAGHERGRPLEHIDDVGVAR